MRRGGGWGGRAIKGRDLARMVDLHVKQYGPEEGRAVVYAHLEEALAKKQLSPWDFSIQDLFRAFCKDSAELLLEMHPKAGSWSRLYEAGAGAAVVGYSDFSNITGQIFFTEIMEKYESEEFVFSKLVESKASTIQDIEKVPGITQIGDDSSIVGENDEYPTLGVGEDWIEVPFKRRRGSIIPVSTLAVRGDKTGALLERCGELGYFLGVNIEKRVIDALIDENAGGNASGAHQGGHRYTWKGTAYATYQETAPWINVVASNALVDETDLEALWRVIVAITNPYTGEPLSIMPTHLIVTPDLYWTAHRIMRATAVRTHAGGYPTSGNPTETVSPAVVTQVLGQLQVASSQLLKTRLTTDSDWFLGNPRKAVRRYYIWDVTPAQRGAGTDAEFYRDVVAEYKASCMDCVSTIQARAMAKSRAAA